LKSEKINLFGRDLIITERKEFDVYEFEEYSKAKENKTSLDVKFEDALFIHQGLKYNYESLCLNFNWGEKKIKIPFRPLRYFKLKKILSPKYLLRNLRISERNDLINKIWFLETGELYDDFVKKKVKAMLETIKKESAVKQEAI